MIEAIIGLIGVVLGFGLSAEYQELKEGRERKKHKGALIEELRANLHMIPQKRQTISNMMNELQQGRMLLGLLYIFQERFSKTVSPLLRLTSQLGNEIRFISSTNTLWQPPSFAPPSLNIGLAGHLGAIGFAKEGARGLASMLGCCRKHDFLDPLILNRIERLRTIRNPFMHLKAFDHPHTIGQRTLRDRRHPFSAMEEDAKESLTRMYAVATTRFGAPKRRGGHND